MRPPVEVKLPRTTAAACVARRRLEERLRAELERSELDSAKLLASELVNNAVIHGKGKITLRAELDADRLRVEVIDEGEGFESTLRVGEFDDVGGWGLRIVDQESSRWGVHEGTTHVWFELERSGPRLGAG